MLHPTLDRMFRFAHLFGFKTWSAALPCPRCTVANGKMFSFGGCSFAGLNPEWGDYDPAGWATEARSRLLKVVVSNNAEYCSLSQGLKLQYHQKKPYPGRLVSKRFIFKGVEFVPGDKLHHGGCIHKLSDFDNLNTFPCDLFFSVRRQAFE